MNYIPKTVSYTGISDYPPGLFATVGSITHHFSVQHFLTIIQSLWNGTGWLRINVDWVDSPFDDGDCVWFSDWCHLIYISDW
jgi:hypothetical protein